MKHNILKTMAAAAIMLAATTDNASAQVALRTGYFNEGYSYRHQLNPALAPDRGYISVLPLGGFNISAQSNIGISNFLYEKPGTNQLMLFTNKNVKADQFLGALKNKNRLGTDLSINIMSGGWHAWGGFNSVEFNLRSTSSLCLPKALFEVVKTLGGRDSYEFGDLGIASTHYAELALGHSRRITDEWRVGGKAKILIGIADVDAHIDQMTLTMNKDEWAVRGSGCMDIAMKGMTMGKDENGNYDFDDVDMDGAGVGGAGFAIDMGATYRPEAVEGLEVSAALNDLGFIRWRKNIAGDLNGKGWVFNGFHISQDDNDENTHDGVVYNSFATELDQLSDDLEDAFKFVPNDSRTSRCRGLGAHLVLGASYKLPMYDRLKFGFLSTTSIHGPYSWSEGRFSANVSPVNCLDVTLDYAASSFGHSLGWLLNVHTRGFAFFIGSDHQFFKVTPQYIPNGRLNANLQMGINFHIGKRHKTNDL